MNSGENLTDRNTVKKLHNIMEKSKEHCNRLDDLIWLQNLTSLSLGLRHSHLEFKIPFW